MTEYNLNFQQPGYVPGDLDFNFGAESGSFHYILHGTNVFTSIWADSTASLTNGKFYVTNSDSLHVINSSQNVIHDYYSTTVAGRTEETLNHTDIVDIGVAYGI